MGVLGTEYSVQGPCTLLAATPHVNYTVCAITADEQHKTHAQTNLDLQVELVTLPAL